MTQRLASQGLLDKPQALFALVLSPTRELAIQIAEQFEALGADMGVRCAVLVGGIDMMAQAIALGKRPHIIVGTPGRVVDHLSNTKVGRAAGKAVMSHAAPSQAQPFMWTGQAIALGRGLHITLGGPSAEWFSQRRAMQQCVGLSMRKYGRSHQGHAGRQQAFKGL